jgi:hypothetical protein
MSKRRYRPPRAFTEKREEQNDVPLAGPADAAGLSSIGKPSSATAIGRP